MSTSTTEEPLFSANRLSILCAQDRRTVEKKLLSVPATKIDGRSKLYSLALALPVLCRNDMAEGNSAMRDAKQREATANADIAEMDREERLGRLVEKKEAEFVMADMLTQIRRR
jgi:hypothetical protein